METTIKITVNAITRSKARTYLEALNGGEKITDPADLVMNNGKVEARINGDTIGYAEIEPGDIPHLYELKLDSTDGKNFTAIMTSGGVAKEEANSALQESKEAAMEKGFSEEEVDKRIEYMEEEGIHISVILRALAFLAAYGMPDKCPKFGEQPLFRNPFPDSPTPIKNMLIAALMRKALILYGEKSTGKNIAAHTIAWLLGLPEGRLGFQRDMSPEDIFGGKGTDNSAAEALDVELALSKILVDTHPEKATKEDEERAARFELLKAQSASVRIKHILNFVADLARNGGVLVCDEINMAHANTLQSFLNPIADTDKVMVIPGYGKINLHPAFVLIGGMNPGYTGSMEMNEATASRCGFIEFRQAPSIKAQLKANFPKSKLPAKYFTICDEFYKDLMRAVAQPNGISNDCLNIRGFVNALECVESFMEATTLKEQLQIYVIDGCLKEGEKTVLNTMLQNKVVI